ncbi:MAG: hypothetical protein CL609_02045 [Anaerolineaceae bacterium]|nr:hypothetical protein [Anaerolineaceae bacterium]
MDHQPFEQWILDQKTLTKQQENLLNEHLSECADCEVLNNSWKAVELTLQSRPIVTPKPGFVSRWQVTLANKKAMQHQMQAIKTFIGISCAILITVGALFTWLLLTNSISDVIVGGIHFFTGFLQTYFNIRAVFVQFLRQAPPFTPYLFWIFAAGWGTVVTALWGFTIWRISRRGTVQND